MTYALAEALIPDGKPLLEGMCLADWENVEGFDWGDLAASEQIILPAAIQARAAGLLRQVRIERPGDSPNQGGYGLVPSPCMEVVWHWWGKPVGQSHDGVVAWLKNRASYVSAHLVISPGRATQLLPWRTASWANGHSWANANSITIEADPNDIPGSIRTGVEVITKLITSGVIHRNFRLTGHRDWYNTECPGAYYPKLSSIRTQIAAPPKPPAKPTIPQEDTIYSYEELIEMNSGIFCIDGKVYRYLVFNTISGWEQEYNNGTDGPLDGKYNNPFAATLRTGSFAEVSPSHFRAIKKSLADLRAGKVEVSGTVTIEGEQA